MELTLSERDITNTVFSTSSGSAEYRTAKKTKAFGVSASTWIYKGIEQIGTVRVASWNKLDTVDVRGHTLHLYRTSFWSSSEAFIASDGRSYKWKLPSVTVNHVHAYASDNLMIVFIQLYSLENGHSKDMIAHYDNGSYGIFSRRRLPKLFIKPQGLCIVDEIVTTLVYMLRLQEEERARTLNRISSM
ncbi:hypothetical protein VKT23_018732 [Stygiomarasmius scandens]|uniref:DUF6593 domain-containing protein n=1 Tax=Marasmiellus scandens TaxID=2682957 RepID=A0ABR1ISL4_9AGAR